MGLHHLSKGALLDKIRMALIGHGHLGKWHAQKITESEYAELDTIVESNKASHPEIQKLYPNVKIVDAIDQVGDQVQGCVISTPTSTHFQLSKFAIEKGLHVFCEKPICESLEKAIQTKEQLVKKSPESVFQVGHSERVHACWENPKLKEKMRAAKSIEITRVAPFKGRATDVSVIQDLMIHDIDLLLFQFGFKVNNVKAIGQKVLSNQYDYVTVQLEGEDDRLAQITASRVDPVELRQIRFCGSTGVTVVDLLNRQIKSFENKELQAVVDYEQRDHLALEQKYFYQSINSKQKQPIFCTIDEAILVQEVMEEIEEVLQDID